MQLLNSINVDSLGGNVSNWPPATRIDFLTNYPRKLGAVARGCGLRGNDIPDAAQEAAIIILKKAAKYDSSRPIWPWASSVARNVSRKIRDRQWKSKFSGELTGEEGDTERA